MRNVLFVLIVSLFISGCGGAYLSWKPTIVYIKDNELGGKDKQGAITVTASPSQPTDIHDLSGLPTGQ